MSESRELDAQIATQIMGWTDVQRDCSVPYGDDTCDYDPANDDKRLNGTSRRAVPLYPINIAQAFKVVEKMREREMTVEISCDYPDLEWDVVFVRREELEPDVYREPLRGEYSSTSLPEAICRAALEAMKEKAKAAGA